MRKINWSVVFNVIFWFGLVGFVAEKFFLPVPPSTLFINLLDLAFIWLIAIGTIYFVFKHNVYLLSGSIFSLLMVALIAVGAVLTGYPDYKTQAQATAFNARIERAVAKAVESAKADEDEPRPQRRLPALRDWVDNTAQAEERARVREIAEQAYQLAADGNEESEVSALVNPQVSLAEGTWNCIPSGCGYVQGDLVWTVRLDQYYLSWFILLVSSLVWATSIGAFTPLYKYAKSKSLKLGKRAKK